MYVVCMHALHNCRFLKDLKICRWQSNTAPWVAVVKYACKNIKGFLTSTNDRKYSVIFGYANIRMLFCHRQVGNKKTLSDIEAHISCVHVSRFVRSIS